MRKLINKNTLFGFIIGLTVMGIVGVSAATLYYSNEVSYKPTDTTWNVDNVKDALDELHEKSSDLPDELTISGTPTWNINSTKSNYTIMEGHGLYLFNKPIDLTKYKYLVLVHHKYEYYNATLGIGVIGNKDATLSECQNISTKKTISWAGNMNTARNIMVTYLDVSELKGDYYPFLYYVSNMYSGYLYYYLTTDETIPTI